MTIGEIREGFTEDTFGRRLSQIESMVARLADGMAQQREAQTLASLGSEGSAALLFVESGEVLGKFMREKFRQEVGIRPFFRIAASPIAPRRNLLNVDDPQVRETLGHPPGSRRDGWNMDFASSRPVRTMTGLSLGDKAFEYLEVHETGHMEFWSPLSEHFCWRQAPEEFAVHPRLYPYPVVEYPTTFLRLYSALLDVVGYHADVWIELEYRNVKGYVLRPGRPEGLGFDIRRVASYGDSHLVVPPVRAEGGFNSDVTAYQLIRFVYAAFQLEENAIPFYVQERGFEFPNLR